MNYLVLPDRRAFAVIDNALTVLFVKKSIDPLWFIKDAVARPFQREDLLDKSGEVAILLGHGDKHKDGEYPYVEVSHDAEHWYPKMFHSEAREGDKDPFLCVEPDGTIIDWMYMRPITEIDGVPLMGSSQISTRSERIAEKADELVAVAEELVIRLVDWIDIADEEDLRQVDQDAVDKARELFAYIDGQK